MHLENNNSMNPLKIQYMKPTITLVLFFLCFVLNAQNIKLTFANAQITNDGITDYYEADILISTIDGLADFKLGIGQLYFNYNTEAFGERVKENGNIEVTYPDGYILGQENVLDIYGPFIINDNTASRVSFAFQQALSAGSMTNNVTATASKLFHLKLTFTDATKSPMVEFEDDESEVDKCRDQFYTACGPDAGGVSLADCFNHPGEVFEDASFDSDGATLSITDNDLAQVVSIYPNPVNQILYIKLKQEASYELFNNLGQTVLTGKLRIDTNTLDVSNLHSGLYLIKINNTMGSVTKKIIIN